MSREQDLEKALREATTKLKEMQNALDQLCAPPLGMVTIVAIDKTTLLVNSGGQIVKLARPKPGKPRIGQQAYINLQTKNIVELVDTGAVPGQMMIVSGVLSDTLVELDAGMTGGNKAVWCADAASCKPGDRVLVDNSTTVVLAKYPPAKPKGKAPRLDAKTTWDDIGGLDEIRDWFLSVLEDPVKHPDIYKFYGITPPKGVLMAGPPGTGKTLIAKAVASSIANAYQSNASGGFILVNGPEILSPFVGVAEQTIRDLFKAARAFKEEHGFPAIIFIDEAEAVLSVRGSMRSSDVDKSIVPAFLAEMDGVDESGAIVILATNRPNNLDPAVVREGRIDRKVIIPRPGLEATYRIFNIHLRARPVAPPLNRPKLAQFATEKLFSDELPLADVHMKNGEKIRFYLRHLVSGAMVATVVNTAAQWSMQRDLKAGQPLGIDTDAISAAVDSIYHSNRTLEHKDALTDLVGNRAAAVAQVMRV